MDSLVCTITINQKPVIFRFIGEMLPTGRIYHVSALNYKDYPAFLMEAKQKEWRIITEVPTEIKEKEPRIKELLEAYLEGQGLDW